jgi:nifR3 family TIM-barrel protein
MMAKAAADLEAVGYDIIDLNFACPAPKVLRRKRGGSLLDEPDRVIEIYRRVRDAVKCPLTVKLRIGINNSEKSKDDFWRIIELFSKENIDMVTIHGRTVTKLYRGTADRKMLGEVKKKYPDMKIAGSGDVFSGEDARDLIGNYGLNAVAVARGAIGNPWIFKEIQAYFDGGDKPAKPDIAEVGRVMLRQFELVCTLFDKKRSVPYFRKFLAGFCKYHRQRKKVLLELMAIRDIDKFKKSVNRLFIPV